MEKRVIDISPRKKIEEKKDESPFVEEPRFRFEGPQFKFSLPKISFKNGLFVIPVILLMGTAVFAYFKLSKAEIEIWPEKDVLTVKTKVTIDKTIKQADFLTGLLPGGIITAEKTVSQEIPSSGRAEKEAKAEGAVRVYNGYSAEPRTLIPSRFVSKEGKVFWSLEKITVPGAIFEKGKLVEAGFLDNVKVRADKAGEEYNIAASTFSLPALVGHPSYTLTYAKSFESMKGGFKKEVSQVTSQDLEAAKNALSEKAKKDCELLLKEKIPSDSNFLDQVKKTEILEASSLAKIGAELEKFDFKAKARSTTLVFKNDDLNNFAKEFVLSQIPEGKKLYLPGFKINYSPENVNLESGKMTLSLQITAEIYSEIEETALKKALVEKSYTEAQVFLENYPQITKAQIELWPFWVKSIPEELEKIKIKQNVDASN